MTQATQTELNRFVKVVDEFKSKLARLKAPAMRSKVYASNDQTLIAEYNTAVTRGNALNNSIASLVGAWTAFKRGYGKVIDTTSTGIGDAIDEIRSWFGYDPAPGIGCYENSQLGAAPLVAAPIAAVAVAGVISAAVILNNLMNKIFIKVEASNIQKQNPNISRGDALSQARTGIESPGFFGGVTPIMLGVGALALYLIFSEKK